MSSKATQLKVFEEMLKDLKGQVLSEMQSLSPDDEKIENLDDKIEENWDDRVFNISCNKFSLKFMDYCTNDKHPGVEFDGNVRNIGDKFLFKFDGNFGGN